MQNILFPAEESVKNTILRILSSEWPLTAKKIYNIAKNKYRHEVSYQAVHKSLRMLVAQGVLQKKGRDFSINIEWIERMNDFTKNLKSNYKKKMPLFLPGLKEFTGEGETRVFVFNSFSEAENYRKRLQEEFGRDKNRVHPYCSILTHVRSPIVYSEMTLRILKIIRDLKIRCYIAVSGGTSLDQWGAKYYKSDLVDIKTGLNCATNTETMVLGDIIIQTYIPDNIKSYIDDTYARTKNIDELRVPVFFKNVYEKKNNIKIIVFRNPEIAEHLRQQIMGYFREDKIAIFDIDRTLFDGFLIYDFAKYLTEKGKFKKILFQKLEKAAEKYIKGRMGYHKLADIGLDLFANGIKGQKSREIDKLSDAFIKDAGKKIFSHSKPLFDFVRFYRKTFAITSSPKEVLFSLKNIFPFDDFIATSLETKNNIYTGKIKRRLALDSDKEREMKDYLEHRNLNLKDSIGFGDSSHDLPFLNAVETAVAINPSNDVLPVAKKKKWIIHNDGDDNNAFMNKIKRVVMGY